VKAVLLLAVLAAALATGEAADQPPGRIDAGDYLAGLVYQPAEVDQWLAGRAFPFCRYDAGLGWLVQPMRRRDGLGGSIATYHYDGPEGARRLIHAADQPGRINTFGDSFTQCDQVSDGETWQEQLAAHLGEPVRNYGVGGYSVYQAYLRMRRVERALPSRLIVLNIYEDDHYRNLDAWRNIRVSKHPLFIEPTLPHLRVDLATGTCTEMPNPCPTPESVRHLADPAWVYERFKDDFVLQIMLAHRNAARQTAAAAAPGVIGIDTRVDEGQRISAEAEARHTRAALIASMHVVGLVEKFARQEGRQVLYVLSYRDRTVVRHLQGGERFEREFVDFLQKRKLNVVDLLAAHAADFKGSSLSPADYVARHYIGHYNPTGNFFTAQAIKDRVVQLLDPAPPAYRLKAQDYWEKK